MLAGRRWLPFPGASDAKQQPGFSGLEAFRALGGAGAGAPTWEQFGEMPAKRCGSGCAPSGQLWGGADAPPFPC